MRRSLIVILLVLFSADSWSKEVAQEPVEITSDSLVVLREQNKGVFKGGVIAKQGKMSMRSDEMTVHFSNSKKQNGVKSGALKGDGGGQNVDRIEAVGKVSLNTPKESADGDRGVYDVKSEIFILTGSVVLKQGGHVLKGSKLVYNKKTGKSVLNGSDKKLQSQDAAKSGRVKGVFIPE